jgi:hypothetical protein
MVTQNSTVSWEEAYKGFFLHKRAVRSPRTALWYRTYVGSLVNWATAQEIELDGFTKRSLDAYLAHRQDTGRKPTTLDLPSFQRQLVSGLSRSAAAGDVGPSLC